MTAQHPNRRPGRPKGQVNSVRTEGTSSARVGDSARTIRTIGTFSVAGRDSGIGGNYSQKCSVCNNKYIIQISELLTLGRGYKMILGALPDEVSDPESRWYLTTDMLRHHVRSNHLPLRDVALQSIITDRMEALGRSIEEHNGIVTDHVVLGRLMMDRYFGHLARNPNWVPETAAVVTVMKMFADAEKEGRQSIDTAVYNQVLAVMVEVIRSVVPNQFEEIMHRVGNNPIVQAVMKEQERQHQQALPSA